jgi:hypothetical protein
MMNWDPNSAYFGSVNQCSTVADCWRRTRVPTKAWTLGSAKWTNWDLLWNWRRKKVAFSPFWSFFGGREQSELEHCVVTRCWGSRCGASWFNCNCRLKDQDWRGLWRWLLVANQSGISCTHSAGVYLMLVQTDLQQTSHKLQILLCPPFRKLISFKISLKSLFAWLVTHGESVRKERVLNVHEQAVEQY